MTVHSAVCQAQAVYVHLAVVFDDRRMTFVQETAAFVKREGRQAPSYHLPMSQLCEEVDSDCYSRAIVLLFDLPKLVWTGIVERAVVVVAAVFAVALVVLCVGLQDVGPKVEAVSRTKMNGAQIVVELVPCVRLNAIALE